jgi:hypothetical protein
MSKYFSLSRLFDWISKFTHGSAMASPVEEDWVATTTFKHPYASVEDLKTVLVYDMELKPTHFRLRVRDWRKQDDFPCPPSRVGQSLELILIILFEKQATQSTKGYVEAWFPKETKMDDVRVEDPPNLFLLRNLKKAVANAEDSWLRQ